MRVFGKRGRIVAACVAGLVMLSVTGVAISSAFAGGTSVPTAKAARKSLSVTVSVSGKTEADVKRDIFPPVAGTLAQVAVTEGQEVKAGQLLATLDADQLDAVVDQAQAAHEQAASQLDSIDDSGPSSEDRDAADAQLSAAKKAYDRAKRACDEASVAAGRAKGADKAAAKARLDAAKTAKEQAYAGYLAAKAGASKLDRSSAGSQRRAAEVGEETSARALARAKANRRKAELRAPIDGVVIFNPVAAPAADGNAAKATAGAAVSPAAAPFTVVDLHTLRFVGQLDESDVPRVKQGAATVVELDAVPGKEYRTKIDVVRPNASTTTNGATVFPVTMRLDNADAALRIGMSGSVNITVDDVKDAVAIPIEALIDNKDGQSVFVVEDGRLVQRKVTAGVMSDTDVQIAKGLKEGEVVAIASGGNLKTGMQVKAGGQR